MRSDLAETLHDIDVAAIEGDGTIHLTSGEPDRPCYLRSTAKPFQALAARRVGLELPAEHLAVTCASHGGYPVHLAIVREILQRHGRTTTDLRTPADWPLAERARDALIARGHRHPRPEFHTCSGQHAGFLAACTVADLDPTTYCDVEHPLQKSTLAIVAEVSGVDPTPTGVDGCGYPTLRGSVSGIARAYGRLARDAELAPIARAMTAYPALVADNSRPDGRFAVTWGAPSKAGAGGAFVACFAGMGIAAKSTDGDTDIAVAAVLETAERLGALPRGTAAWLADVRRPTVVGGGSPVGHLELVSA